MQPVAVIGGLMAAASERIMEIEVRDNQGVKSDSVDITLDDRDHGIQIPSEGAELTVAIGYVETGLVFKGIYTVDSMTVNAQPYTVKLSAKALDMKNPIKEKNYRSYTNQTLGGIVNQVAGRHGFGAQISGALASHQIDYEAQSEESDLHLLSRLADRYDATFKIANRQVLFAERGELASVSGLPMGACAVGPGNIVEYRCDVVQRPQHAGGRGRGWNRRTGREIREDGPTTSTSGSGRSRARNQARGSATTNGEARRRGGARGNKSKRQRGQLSLTIVGDPTVTAESPVFVFGVRAGVDGVWRAKSVSHRLSGSQAFLTKIECEKPNNDRSASSVGIKSGPQKANPNAGPGTGLFVPVS